MRERNLYRGTSDFQGSIDEDGRIYDERHRLVGRIEGNVVYDSCNIKQGTIDENGKLWDVNHTYVGQARGSNFIGPSYQSIGMTRGDSTGEGDGSEYGALMMLKSGTSIIRETCQTATMTSATTIQAVVVTMKKMMMKITRMTIATSIGTRPYMFRHPVPSAVPSGARRTNQCRLPKIRRQVASGAGVSCFSS